MKTIEASPSVHIPDSELPSAPRSITIRAMPGCAIVWFLPYRRSDGLIELPDQCQHESVEAIVIDDATGYGIASGTKVLVSRVKGEGIYFEVPGCDERFCRIKREGLYLIDDDYKAA